MRRKKEWNKKHFIIKCVRWSDSINAKCDIWFIRYEVWATSYEWTKLIMKRKQKESYTENWNALNTSRPAFIVIHKKIKLTNNKKSNKNFIWTNGELATIITTERIHMQSSSYRTNYTFKRTLTDGIGTRHNYYWVQEQQ